MGREGRLAAAGRRRPCWQLLLVCLYRRVSPLCACIFYFNMPYKVPLYAYAELCLGKFSACARPVLSSAASTAGDAVSAVWRQLFTPSAAITRCRRGLFRRQCRLSTVALACAAWRFSAAFLRSADGVCRPFMANHYANTMRIAHMYRVPRVNPTNAYGVATFFLLQQHALTASLAAAGERGLQATPMNDIIGWRLQV